MSPFQTRQDYISPLYHMIIISRVVHVEHADRANTCEVYSLGPIYTYANYSRRSFYFIRPNNLRKFIFNQSISLIATLRLERQITNDIISYHIYLIDTTIRKHLNTSKAVQISVPTRIPRQNNLH